MRRGGQSLALVVELVVALGVVVTANVAAQGTGQPPRPTVADSMRRVRGDTIRKDTIVLVAPDSAERALLERRGYIATRYQGDSVVFTAADRGLQLWGEPARVQREQMKVLGTSITYDDLRQTVRVAGVPGRVVDPARNQDLIAFGPITYDLGERRGTAVELRTTASTGSIWYVSAGVGAVASDSTTSTTYGKNATITTDPDTANPHYHFKVGEVKEILKRWMVARPAVLYVGEVPVVWIPWLFQDLHVGRRSGILTPRFTFSELVRNRASYRRNVENLGFFVALSDYYDMQASVDWRSGARPTANDPGFWRINSTARYGWRDRFIGGSIGYTRQMLDDGGLNQTFAWQHKQDFSLRTHVNANVNYSTNTRVAQQTELNPYVVMGTILSQVNYQTQFGPFQTSIGAGQRQYPARDQIDRDFPTLNISAKPIELAPWLTWTPSLTASSSQSLHIDSPSEFGFRYTPRPGGGVDSVRIDRSSHNTTASLSTPLKVGSFAITASTSFSDRENNFPEARVVVDPADTSIRRTIVYERTYFTSADFNVGMNLPQLSQGKWNITPGVSLQNVDPGGFLVRSERTGADWVSQSKRFVYSLSVSPTVFGLFQMGFGPFSAIRHSVSPQITYSYSPAATVSDEYLGALGRTRAGYLGALPQNRVSLTLNQVFEARVRESARQDTTASAVAPRKIKLMSLGLSALTYDFERARVARNGFATDQISASLRSDLVPGFEVSTDYSLFDAPSISDTANFSPFRTGVRASLTLGKGAGGLGFLGRIAQWATGERGAAARDTTAAISPAVSTGTLGGMRLPGAGRSRPAISDIPVRGGWQASFTLSSTRPRPPRGNNVIAFDPTLVCEPLRANLAQYKICLQQQVPLNIDPTQTQTTAGGVIFRLPAQTSVTGNLSFNLTPNWAAQWQTSYDVVRGEFASQIVTLQRDLYDWRALFGFSQAPNGNFGFHFVISLKPAPDIRIPYDQPGYRARSTTNQR
jgi:hypothetical protein